MQDNHERIQEKFKRELGEKLFTALQDATVMEMMLNEDGKVWLDTFKGMYYFTTMPSMRWPSCRSSLSSCVQPADRAAATISES